MHVRRRVLAQALAAIPLAIALLLSPGGSIPDTLACSCAMQEHPVREAANEPGTVVFAGIPQPQGPRGVDVQLTRWFSGPQPGIVLTLDPQGFLDPNGGSCGTNPPTPGQEWIFVTARTERGTYGVHLCTPHAPTTGDLGAEMLRDAIELYGPGTIAEPEPPPPDIVSDDVPLPAVLGATLGVGLLVLAGAALLARRSRPAARP